MKKIILIVATVLFANLLSAQVSEANIIGVWTVGDGSARVKIEKIGSKYYGKTIWLKEPNDSKTGKPKVDVNNPDPALRTQPRLGLRTVKDFVHDGNGEFSSGNIYDPAKGKTYCGKLTLKDANTLKLKGYICGFKALSRSQTWTRYTGN